METMLFDQAEKIGEILENPQSRSIDTKCDKIMLTGHPEVKFNGVTEIINLVLRIEKVEVTHVFHPLAPVDKRPSSGMCNVEHNMCMHRRSDGRCTSNPLDEGEKCKYRSGIEDCCEDPFMKQVVDNG